MRRVRRQPGVTSSSCSIASVHRVDVVEFHVEPVSLRRAASASTPISLARFHHFGTFMTRAIASPRRLTRAPRTRLRLDRLEDRAVPALVAALAFNEGTGPTAADASGSGNVGTLTGASWIAGGRYGGALSFDGTNDWVTVADAASLDLTTGMTLEAWVRPSAINGWETVLLKEMAGSGLAYALYAADGGGRPPAGYVFVGGDRAVVGSTVLPLNAWTHLATTYDGAIQRLFVNGMEVATRAQSGGISTSTGALRVGGNSVWGEYFGGLIDEVRVYSHALTAAQVQADMNTPIGGSGDTRAPTVTAVSPLMGATGVSATVNFTATFSEGLDPATVTTTDRPAPQSGRGGRTGRSQLQRGHPDRHAGPDRFAARGRRLLPGHCPRRADRSQGRGRQPVGRRLRVGSVHRRTSLSGDNGLFSGLINPTVIEFAPDGRVFVAEKSGLIKVFDNLHDTTPTVFADLRTNVYNAWDRGLLGMALPPDFATSPYVYVLYTLDAHTDRTAPVWGTPGVSGDPLPNPPGATGNGVVVDARLSRVPVLGNGHGRGRAGAGRKAVDPTVPQPLDRVGRLRGGRGTVR